MYALARQLEDGNQLFRNGHVFYFHNNFDLMVVGRRLGAADRLLSRSTLPCRRTAQPDYHAHQAGPFPGVCGTAGRPARFQNGARKSIRLLALVVVPVGFGMAAIAEEIVNLLYGGAMAGHDPAASDHCRRRCGACSIFGDRTVAISATNRVSLAFVVSAFSMAVFFASIARREPVGKSWNRLGIPRGLRHFSAGSGSGLSAHRAARPGCVRSILAGTSRRSDNVGWSFNGPDRA